MVSGEWVGGGERLDLQISRKQLHRGNYLHEEQYALLFSVKKKKRKTLVV